MKNAKMPTAVMMMTIEICMPSVVAAITRPLDASASTCTRSIDWMNAISCGSIAR